MPSFDWVMVFSPLFFIYCLLMVFYSYFYLEILAISQPKTAFCLSLKSYHCSRMTIKFILKNLLSALPCDQYQSK